MKIVNIDEEIIHNFQRNWGTSIKLAGKMWLMIMLSCVILILEDRGIEIDSPSLLKVKLCRNSKTFCAYSKSWNCKCNLKAETISKFFYRLANCSYDVTVRFLTPLDLFYYLVFGFWFKIGVNIYFSQEFNLQCLSVRESNRLVEFVETRFKYITLNLVGVYLIIF